MDTSKTRELFAPLIQRPILTDQLLQRPPFKFLHDIVRETLQQTGYPDGLFTPDELDAAKAGSSRENKVAFLQKLIDVLNVDGHLDNVNPAKIVAGKEAEMTNLLLRSLASEATVFLQEKKKLTKKSPSSTSKSKSSSSKRDEDGSNNKEKTTKPLDPSRKAIKETTEVKKSSSRSKSKEKESGAVSSKDKSKAAKEDIRSSTTTAKDKERKKKRSKTAVNNREAAEVEQQPSPAAAYIIPLTPQQQDQLPIGYGNTSLPDSRRTPPDRESSGGTSKGGDDSGIADETGAESERHDLFTVGEPSKNSTPDFIEVHASSSPLLPHPIRPGTAIGRPQTAVGRPGTALARPAPPKPKKNIIGTNVNAENEEPQQQQTAAKPQIQLILENKEEQKAEENFLVEEDDDQLFIGIGTTEGANISKLQEGEEHGVLVNKIIENTRELEKEQKQSGEFVEPGDTFDLHEQRRIFAEVDSAQKSLQKATQNVQPLVRIMEFVVDDFDSMLRELVEYRKQSALFERQLNERAADESSQTAKLGGELRALDDDMTHIRNQVASMKASIMRNESKITELLASNSH